ncbi:MAG TPA: hypothetical protein VMF52_05395 [Steroidobacteraceae bacterium]|nr:hypothetical protein [Steroidobacteraceae bacterium]
MTSGAGFPRATLTLAAIALLALPTALLAPDDWIGGIDVGSLAATLYALSLGVVVWWVARAPEDPFPEEWLVDERRGWSGVFFGSLVLMSFAHLLWSEAQQPDLPMTWQLTMFRHFGWNLGMLLVAAVVVHRVLGARRAEAVERDERDLRIAHEGALVANTFLTLLMLGLVVLLAMFPDSVAGWLRPQIVANVLIGLLIARTLAEHITIVARYRRERR